jgi:hypothetical protein
LRKFGSKILMGICGPERKEVIRGWRNFAVKSSMTCVLFTSNGIRWAEHVTRMGENRNSFTVFVGKPEEKAYVQIIVVGGRKILR